MNAQTKDPSWWTKDDTSGWDKVKDAFKRDWEQTKADLSGNHAGHDLKQSAGDTAKQAAGKEAIPPANVPNTTFDKYEAALRFGYGARTHHPKWNDDVEKQLSKDWTASGHPSKWDEVKSYVKHSWTKSTH